MNYKDNYRIDYDFLKRTFDDEQLEMMESEETHSLVRELVEYSNELVENILELRKEVNEYDRKLRLERKENMKYYQAPYEDLHSDIFRSFTEHQVYLEFKEELDKMIG